MRIFNLHQVDLQPYHFDWESYLEILQLRAALWRITVVEYSMILLVWGLLTEELKKVTCQDSLFNTFGSIPLDAFKRLLWVFNPFRLSFEGVLISVKSFGLCRESWCSFRWANCHYSHSGFQSGISRLLWAKTYLMSLGHAFWQCSASSECLLKKCLFKLWWSRKF